MKYLKKIFESKLESKYYGDIQVALSDIMDRYHVAIHDESEGNLYPSFSILVDIGMNLRFGDKVTSKEFDNYFKQSKEIASVFNLFNEFITRMDNQMMNYEILFNYKNGEVIPYHLINKMFKEHRYCLDHLVLIKLTLHQ